MDTTAFPAMHRRTSGLVMTDYGFLFALGLALVVAVDPLEMNLERIIYIKHLPMAFMLGSLILTVMGGQIFRWREKRPSSLPALTPLLLLAVFIIAGGFYARLFLDIRNSFLVAGLYMLVAPMAAAILLRCPDPVKLQVLRTYFLMLAAAGAVVFTGLALNYGVRQVYHELEYLFPPLAVLCAFLIKRPWLRYAGIALSLLTAALFKKNTGYIVGLLAASYLIAFYFWPHWSRQSSVLRYAKKHWLLVGCIAFSLLAAFLILNRDSYLPSGNPSYRLVTYEQAWLRFRASPVIGSAFTSAASEKFTAFDTGVSDNVLPSHSDVLDIFANGGVLGVALWLWALLKIAWMTFQEIRNNGRHPLLPYAHALVCMSLAGILTYTFNPIFLQPAKALLLWTNLGLLVAIVLSMRKDRAARHRKI